MTWRLVIARRAEQEMDELDPAVRARIVRALERLAASPYQAANVKALKGGGYRLRVGDYRVLYQLEADVLIVLVLRVAHRREVYRR